MWLIRRRRERDGRFYKVGGANRETGSVCAGSRNALQAKLGFDRLAIWTWSRIRAATCNGGHQET